MSDLIAPIVVSMLSRSGENLKISGDDKLCEAFAEACGVSAFERFDAFVKVQPFKKGGAKLSGTLSALVVQPCVVSMEPVEQQIEIAIERSFLPAPEIAKRNRIIEDGELILDPDQADEPDEIENGEIDTWQVLVEELCLEIDLYPRKENVEVDAEFLTAQEQETTGDEAVHRPFSALNTLINKKKTQK